MADERERGLKAPRWVRVAEKCWKAVDAETGLCLETGTLLEEWRPARDSELKISQLDLRRSKERTPSDRLKDSVVALPDPDPNGKTWAKRNPLEAYTWARLAFIRDEARGDEIAARTGFSVHQIDRWAYKSSSKRDSWAIDRKKVQNQVLRAVVKKTKDRCVKLADDMLAVLETRMQHMRDDAEQGKALKVSEIKALVSAVHDLGAIAEADMAADQRSGPTNKDSLSREEILEKLKVADSMMHEVSEPGSDETTH